METTVNKTAFRKLGFEKEESKEVVKHLNDLLANYHIHYQKLRNYHWNVKGDDFFDLHETFERLYNNVKVNIDEVAERIRVFGHTPVSTLSEYLDMSEIEETGTDLTDREMVEEVLKDITIVLSYMVTTTESAAEIGDVGTVDMINSFVQKVEKDHWMLNAWLSKK